jgi:hypothetical protein
MIGAMTCLPGKPKLIKRNGVWLIIVPEFVFGNHGTGSVTQAGFQDLPDACKIAIGIANAIIQNTELRHNQPIQIASVD